MKHEKTFETISKLKDIEIELHRLKNALEMANRALDAQRTWVGLNLDDAPEIYVGDTAFLHGAQWAESKLKEKNNG